MMIGWRSSGIKTYPILLEPGFANAKLGLVEQIHNALNGVNGAVARVPSKHGNLVCDFSSNRYKKELNELNKLVQKAEAF